MRYFAPIAAFAFAAGVSAVDPTCEANYILQACLADMELQAANCGTQDWDCLCPKYQNMRNCYNNCPKDPDVQSADGQVLIFCQNASLYGTKTTTKTTATPTTSTTTTPTSADAKPTDSGSKSDSTPTTDGNSEETGFSNENQDAGNNGAVLARNTGAVLVTIAGAIALLL